MKILLFTIMMLCMVVEGYAANYPLAIAYPIAPGTGTPAISASMPIFKAYPGVAYNIRPNVQGGSYPFTFALSGQPTGMTIDADTGEINWPNPDTTTGTITLTVTDAEATQVSSTWAVTVGTSGYVFVSSTYSGFETGSITQPYASIANLLTSHSTVTDIVYFRGGSYALPTNDMHDGTGHDCSLDSESVYWIGYPGETVTIDMNVNYLQGGSSGYYLDNLTFIDMPDWFIHEVNSSFNYSVLRRLDLSGGRAVYRFDNANQGVYYTSAAGNGYYLTIQDNIIHSMDDLHAVGSLYDQYYPLVEDNTIFDMTSTIGGRPVFASKHNGTRHTFRHNNIYNVNGRQILGGSSNGLLRCIEDVEVLFNRFDAGSTSMATWWNNDALGAPDARDECSAPYIQGTTNVYRNTIVGHIVHNHFNSDTCGNPNGGPYTYEDNVIINEGTSYTSVSGYSFRYPESTQLTECITDSSNVKGAAADNIVDTDGMLVGSYSTTYLGVAGWEIGESTPVEPTCSDGIQNGDETGVDCGGSCDACDTVAAGSQAVFASGNWAVSSGGNRYVFPASE